MQDHRLGLIAGHGSFPVRIAQSAKRQGRSVVAAAVRGEADRALAAHCDSLEWIGAGELGRAIRFFRSQGVRDAILAGSVRKTRMYSPLLLLDPSVRQLLARVKDRKDRTLLSAVVSVLESEGFRVLDSTLYVREDMMPEGVLTRRLPSPEEQSDVDFGYELARRSAQLDIGQTLVVKNRAVLAVEAIEGTDDAIARGSRLGRRNVVVIKVSRPDQDFRYDVPLVGLHTVSHACRMGVRVLAVEAGRTLFVDRAPAIRHADRHGLCILGLAAAPAFGGQAGS